ncbi:MAG: ParA family protein [Gammaproteobacteria bacterium]|nr:ParA family protein [Gammaproteobacteria bacterium]
MSIIAIVGNKGGAGKTTLSVNLATGLNNRSRTAVIDADPQRSSLQWNAFSENDALSVYAAEEALGEQANELKQDYDRIIIDCPPSVYAPQTHKALIASEHAIIPVQPSPMDLWATVHIVEAVEKAQDTNPELRPLLVINQLEPRTVLSRLVRDAVSEIGIPVADAMIRRRAIFRSSALEGKSVYEVGRRGEAAVEEIEKLIQEIIQ